MPCGAILQARHDDPRPERGASNLWGFPPALGRRIGTHDANRSAKKQRARGKTRLSDQPERRQAQTAEFSPREVVTQRCQTTRTTRTTRTTTTQLDAAGAATTSRNSFFLVVNYVCDARAKIEASWYAYPKNARKRPINGESPNKHNRTKTPHTRRTRGRCDHHTVSCVLYGSRVTLRQLGSHLAATRTHNTIQRTRTNAT